MKRRASWWASRARTRAGSNPHAAFYFAFAFVRGSFGEEASREEAPTTPGRRHPPGGGAREAARPIPRRRKRRRSLFCEATRPRAGRARPPSRRRGGWRDGDPSRSVSAFPSFRFSSTTCRRRTRALRGTMIGLLGTKTPAASGAARRATSGRRGHRSGVRPRRWTRPRPVGAWGRYRPGNSPGASSSPEMPNRPPGMTRHRNARPPSRGRTGPRLRGRTREATRRPPPETPRLRAMPRRGARGTGAPTPPSRPRPMQKFHDEHRFSQRRHRVADSPIGVVSPAVGRHPRADEVILLLRRSGRHRRHTTGRITSPPRVTSRASPHRPFAVDAPSPDERAATTRTRAFRLARHDFVHPSAACPVESDSPATRPSRGTLRCGSSPALFRTRFLAETSTARASCLKSAST